MAKKRAFFTLKTWEEIHQWGDAWDKELERQGLKHGPEWPAEGYWDSEKFSKENEEFKRELHLRDAAEEAEPGQYVVVRRSEFVKAKRIGALPNRLRRIRFENMPEGIPTQFLPATGRQIIPGVEEEVSTMRTMSRKGRKRFDLTLSRADIEAASNATPEELEARRDLEKQRVVDEEEARIEREPF